MCECISEVLEKKSNNNRKILEKLCRKRTGCFICGILFDGFFVCEERKTRVSQWKKSIGFSKGFQRENI